MVWCVFGMYVMVRSLHGAKYHKNTYHCFPTMLPIVGGKPGSPGRKQLMLLDGHVFVVTLAVLSM